HFPYTTLFRSKAPAHRGIDIEVGHDVSDRKGPDLADVISKTRQMRTGGRRLQRKCRAQSTADIGEYDVACRRQAEVRRHGVFDQARTIARFMQKEQHLR